MNEYKGPGFGWATTTEINHGGPVKALDSCQHTSVLALSKFKSSSILKMFSISDVLKRKQVFIGQ